MGGGWFDRQDPWFPAFALSAVALAASTFALAVVLFTATNEPSPSVAAEPAPFETPTPVLDADIRLSYSGPLPALLAESNLKAVGNSSSSDITFVPGDPAGEPVRYFIPIAAIGTGVDTLTAAQAESLLRGSVSDWSEVGGLPGSVVRAAVIPPADPATTESISGWLGNLAGVVTFTTYAELRAAMTLNSGIIALVPIEEVRFTQLAIAIDGIDPVRGSGDIAAWPYAERIAVVASTKKGAEAVEEVRLAIRAKTPAPITVVATGDILQSRCALARIRDTGDWAAALRGPVAEYLASADLALGSLDGSIQDIGTAHGCVQTTNLTSPPEVMEALTLAGIDGVTVATNHIFDCGQTYCGNKAFLRTLELLAAANIKATGGGENLEAALAPSIFEVGGVRFGVLGFDDIAAEDFEATETAPGTAPLDDSYDDERDLVPRSPAFFQSADMLNLTRFSERIRQLKTQVDVVIVQVQTGTEDTHRPSQRSIKALRAAADAGADLVVGNQAHWVQAIETRDDAFIAYALGNFIFDQTHTPEHTHGYLLESTFHGKTLVALRFVPYQIENKYKPTFVTGETRLKILGDVFEASRALPAP